MKEEKKEEQGLGVYPEAQRVDQSCRHARNSEMRKNRNEMTSAFAFDYICFSFCTHSLNKKGLFSIHILISAHLLHYYMMIH